MYDKYNDIGLRFILNAKQVDKSRMQEYADGEAQVKLLLLPFCDINIVTRSSSLKLL